jgi:aldehyde:ferredoxin oxidoreductase
MSYLYAGNILIVDLSSGKITKEPTSKYADEFLGGRGINMKLFYDHVARGIDPLSAENVLVFGVGPLASTGAAAARTEVTAKSPETGYLGSSNFGGYFGGELKYAGYDHLVFKGKAERPVYLWIHNDQVEIRDAGAYWGKDTFQTQEMIRRDLENPEIQVACIGPAGEHVVRFASIRHGIGDTGHRTGMGAVMGSKNLKAVVVRGTHSITVADPVKFLELVEEYKNRLKADPKTVEISTRGITPHMDHGPQGPDWEIASSVLPWLKGKKAPSTVAVTKVLPYKRTGCQACPIQCFELYEKEGAGRGAFT